MYNTDTDMYKTETTEISRGHPTNSQSGDTRGIPNNS